MATHKVGDTILLETARTAKHYGYALLADDDSVFYVGVTMAPEQRLRQHVYTGSRLVRERLQANKLNRLRILAGPMNESEARSWEEATISEMLSNGVRLVQETQPFIPGAGKKRHPAVLRFAGRPPES